MKSCRFNFALVLLGVFLALCSLNTASHLDWLTGYKRFLMEAQGAAVGPQDWIRMTEEGLLPKLSQHHGEAPEGPNMRLAPKRSADNSSDLPRLRKAGCRNFYWKTYTSC